MRGRWALQQAVPVPDSVSLLLLVTSPRRLALRPAGDLVFSQGQHTLCPSLRLRPWGITRGLDSEVPGGCRREGSAEGGPLEEGRALGVLEVSSQLWQGP